MEVRFSFVEAFAELRCGLAALGYHLQLWNKKAHNMFKLLGCLVKLVLMVAIVAVLAVVGTNAAVVLTSRDGIVDGTEALQFDADAIVVLGASVMPDGTPSDILKSRLDEAIALYEAGAAPKIIMSGDNGTASYNECWAMKLYAVDQGVPSEDVFCDHAGFSTYETMYRVRHVFGAERIIVSTQTYHQYRAIYDARGVGMQAIGVSNDQTEYADQSWYDLREIPARTKDFLQVLFHVPSTYVGDPISLDQSGDVTN